MGERDDPDRHRLDHSHRIADALYDRLGRQVIRKIKTLPDDCRQSGDGSRFKDVWEEFKFQLQREQSIFFRIYEDTILRICSQQVGRLDSGRRELLWLWSGGFEDWEHTDSIPGSDMLTGAVADELYRRVVDIASDEQLLYDPEDAGGDDYPPGG